MIVVMSFIGNLPLALVAKWPVLFSEDIEVMWADHGSHRWTIWLIGNNTVAGIVYAENLDLPN